MPKVRGLAEHPETVSDLVREVKEVLEYFKGSARRLVIPIRRLIRDLD